MIKDARIMQAMRLGIQRLHGHLHVFAINTAIALTSCSRDVSVLVTSTAEVFGTVQSISRRGKCHVKQACPI